MSGDNGAGETKVGELKICPFLAFECIKEKCALNAELRQSTAGGLMRKQSICGFGAMLQLLSEINQKTPPPQQRQPDIEIPRIFLGRG